MFQLTYSENQKSLEYKAELLDSSYDFKSAMNMSHAIVQCVQTILRQGITQPYRIHYSFIRSKYYNLLLAPIKGFISLIG